MSLINQDNEKPVHDEFSHALRAFEYYCWNLSVGDVGGVHQKQPSKIPSSMITKVDLDAFGKPNKHQKTYREV